MACAGTIAGLVTGLFLAATEPVVIGTEAPFPPYSYLDEAGTLTGFDRDLMDEICLRAALNCSWQLANFDELIPGVMSGEFDIIIGGIAITEERQHLVDFSTPYDQSTPEEWYLGYPDAPPPEAAQISVQSGTVHEAYLRDHGLTYTAYATEPEALEALVNGAADLALGPFESREDIQGFVDAMGLDYLYSVNIPDHGIGMAVCKGNDDLLDRLNAALDAMSRDGTLDEINSRWFG